jgi:DNA invertase Pin-like site-specific DNA recombinase
MQGVKTNVVLKKRCAIYTRKSTEENLDTDFNSLDAQREAGEAYVASQRNEGWVLLPDRYDDGGFSGGTMDRPALKRLMADIEAGKVDCVVVYKVDRLSRSLLDFTRLVEVFDRRKVSFVSVTQHFNTTDSMGRLTLNILLSFAQFEREIIAERIRDKVAAAKRKGKHCGGVPVLGYDIKDGKLVVNPAEARLVRHIFQRFTELGSTVALCREINEQGYKTKSWLTQKGILREGRDWDKKPVYDLLNNVKYLGRVSHKGQVYQGEHEAIIPQALWDKVHAILRTNHHCRAAHSRAETPALLKGLVTCGHCQKSMGVTFTRKAGRMYRYYLCLRAARESYDACPVKSVAAGMVEEAVLAQVRQALNNPEIVARTARAARAETPITDDEVRQAFGSLDHLWDELFPGEQARITQLLVQEVVVHPDRIDVRLRAEGMGALLAELHPQRNEPKERMTA